MIISTTAHKSPDLKLRFPVRRDTLRKDAVAGVVLGVESVPDGLAAGLLAGVSPLSGLYAYLFGTIGGSLFTSSAFMAVQATGAMAIVIADVPAVHAGSDPARALFTLSVLTGVVMLAAGFLRLGSVLRFVSNAVMVGFISAVGVNIILGQLANLTGYKAEGANRVVRAFNTLIHPGELHLQSLAIGVLTVALIVLLERTRLGPLGLVLAVVVTSALVAVLGWGSVALVRDLSDIPRALPLPQAPMLRLVPSLVVPALSLAFVGLIQGVAGGERALDAGPATPWFQFGDLFYAEQVARLVSTMSLQSGASRSPRILAARGRTCGQPDDDPMELHYLPDDFSQADNIAAQHPKKVTELQNLSGPRRRSTRSSPCSAA